MADLTTTLDCRSKVDGDGFIHCVILLRPSMTLCEKPCGFVYPPNDGPSNADCPSCMAWLVGYTFGMIHAGTMTGAISVQEARSMVSTEKQRRSQYDQEQGT